MKEVTTRYVNTVMAIKACDQYNHWHPLANLSLSPLHTILSRLHSYSLVYHFSFENGLLRPRNPSGLCVLPKKSKQAL